MEVYHWQYGRDGLPVPLNSVANAVRLWHSKCQGLRIISPCLSVAFDQPSSSEPLQ